MFTLPADMQSVACVRGKKVFTATQSVPAPVPFHFGPAAETEHRVRGIEVH